MKNLHIICGCSSSEHTLRFIYDKEDPDMIYTEVYLNQHNSILKRIWIAFKYVLGYTSKYGHFDCTLMDKNTAKKLHFFLKDFIKNGSTQIRHIPNKNP
jgi:hypothetical protein